jgi:hypothetical protein
MQRPRYEYALFGSKNGVEDLIRVNGKEVQTNLATAKKMRAALNKRGDFQNVRIHVIDLGNPRGVNQAFINAINI